ncbi:hypothetical protein [Nonomuraea aurantiaca]|uniref:hypothetical protein n=1 Tax=Nonomuraea aurantiaca TaxID=2878562 RepID=UPI001CD9EC7A|nr:hypothetical protein [Nonomuraea aurantiaca]MCA2224103.1 hypothetical protein [Nonomuraea aurantiaca]
MLELIGSVVVPVGVALYAMLYLGIQQMYWVFDINPEQAGIDQSVLLGRLMGTLIMLLLILLPLIGILVAVGWLLDKVTRGAVNRLVQAVRRRPWIAAVIAAAWCGVTYLSTSYVLTLEISPLHVLGALVLGVLAFVVPFRLLRRKPVGRAGMKVLVGALTGIGLGMLLLIGLIMGAGDVRNTGQANDLLNMVGFQDQWVVVKDGDDKPLYDGRDLMLLGESDGTYVFYDCDYMTTFRRPAESTNLGDIRLDPEREPGYTCGSLVKDEEAKPKKS